MCSLKCDITLWFVVLLPISSIECRLPETTPVKIALREALRPSTKTRGRSKTTYLQVPPIYGCGGGNASLYLVMPPISGCERGNASLYLVMPPISGSERGDASVVAAESPCQPVCPARNGWPTHPVILLTPLTPSASSYPPSP